MHKTEKLTIEEFKTLEKLYNKNFYKFLFGCLGVIFGFFILFIIISRVPAKYIGRRGLARGIDETIVENLGPLIPISIFLVFVIYIIIVLNNELKITRLKKDLKEKNKIVTSLKVSRIENFSNEKIKDLKELGLNSTNELFFKKNPFKINRYAFNKQELPEFINAKEIQFELAKYSKHEFKKTILK